MSQDLLEVVKDGVAILTMNRPDRLNALSHSMLGAMLEALSRLGEDRGVGVVVLTGAGRAFCAGGDVKAMAEGREAGEGSLEEKAQALRARMETSRWLHEMPKPTIAMVRGAAAGAGLSLALACDLRIAGDTARFGTAFARVGYSQSGMLAEVFDLEAWHHTRCGMTEDHREAARAFVEKREPVFRGC